MYLTPYTKNFKKFNLVNFKYGHIKFIKKLGEGSTGSVYKCLIHNKKYTIKIFDLENYTGIDGLIEDVYNEMYISNMLKNSVYNNTIKGYSIYNRLNDVKIYLIYEYYNKPVDLREFINNSYDKSKYILSNKNKLSIIKQLIYGLKEIKEKRITHCDIKLENIIIFKNKDEYNIKYIDYGGSCYMENDMYDSSEYDYNFGTTGYMPIEVYNKQIYYASDIYSLAVCIIEILIGKIWTDTNNYSNCRKEVKTSLSEIKDKKIKKYLIRCLSENYKIRPDIYNFENEFITLLHQQLDED
tara:strand:- start:1915 stop:2805 length:891 start_codon:yes stop_codon:yes gene_type:complete